jgi:epoxide hydrolase-like predicted phosphatase
MSTIQHIRAVVFDIGGILEVGPDGAEPAHSFDGLRARWRDRMDMDAFDAYLAETRLPGSIGTIAVGEWEGGLAELLGGDEGLLAELLEDLWNVYLGELNGELARWFRALRPRYRTAMLSNSFIGAREREEARYRLSEMADFIVYSHEEGLEKPDRRIYEITCERLALAPPEVLFLDDVESYVEGARAVGMHAVHYRDNAQAIREMEAML